MAARTSYVPHTCVVAVGPPEEDKRRDVKGERESGRERERTWLRPRLLRLSREQDRPTIFIFISSH